MRELSSGHSRGGHRQQLGEIAPKIALDLPTPTPMCQNRLGIELDAPLERYRVWGLIGLSRRSDLCHGITPFADFDE